MEEIKEDFLTPEERASLGPKVGDISQVIKNNIPESGGRPTIITVLCGYFFVSWILSILSTIGIITSLHITSYSLNLTGFSLQGWLGIIFSFIYVISIFGYWAMKKWGVYLYTVLAILLAILSFVTTKTISFFFILSLILPIFVIWAGLKHLNRMD
jgi:hypothetical protein